MNPARRSNSAGFTLIELMVALVISGIIAGVVFDLILGQTRFARYQNAREEVQQNARAALEVISAELRGVPPEAIITAGANNIQFRLPRAWGILCTTVTAASPSITVRFPAGLFPTVAEMPLTPIPGGWGIAVGQVTDASLIPASWSFVAGASGAAGNCDGSLLQSVPANQGDDRTFTGAGFVPANSAITVPIGAPVFVWQEVAYDLTNTSSLGGNWIRRNTQSNPQPMAGPVPAVSGPNAGLQFTYLDADGDEAAKINQIASIRLEVRTESRAKFNNTPQTQTARTEIYLRNRN